jgi:hypothetical protein
MGKTPDCACVATGHTHNVIMPNQNSQRLKSALSEYQKQMRFLIWLAIFISLLFALAFIWLLNRTSISAH